MIDTRYRERSYLVDYDLSSKLFERFNLKVSDLMPMRSSFFIKTDEGNKLLKKMECSMDELNFIASGIKYTRNNFDRVIDFVKVDNGKIYTVWNNEIYCVMNLVEGRECKYTLEEDIRITAKSLGEMHNASEGFRYELPSKYMGGKLIDSLKRKLEEVEFCKHIVRFCEYPRKFDEIFITNVDYYIDQIKKSINIIEDSQYYKLCSEEDKIVLCHNELEHHNIIIKDDKAYFMNFDNAIIDIKVHDVCNLINRVVKIYDYDIIKAELILKNYCLKSSLDRREMGILYGMLYFPVEFYNITKDYYTRRRKWDEEVFDLKLQNKINHKEKKKKFLEEFEKDIK